jgi:enamine deaminase RidA (YjgF/YER057c/UK114 family)
VFGPENGVGVRSAVGMGSLPENVPVEIEALFEIIED